MPSNQLMFREADGTPRMAGEQYPLPVTQSPSSGLTAFDHGSIVVDATAGGVAIPDVGDATKLFATVEDGQIRYTYDGTAPSDTVGHLAYVGDHIILEGNVNIVAARFFRDTATSGTLHYTLER